ncbi:Uncharacterised protein [Cedecea neteri]|uniref:Uncharacterized protein n=1 Tax=Cedecea neteri TaxID=158822 RepID=A0A291DXS9_9ENTR|nr:hypothetical protein [Cedecea neteri]ATF92499.1 hypothetical protein CO704_10565 [Cedecea neteri]SQC92382.1 Uncharacterised protein [Cedecea neteri]
MISRDFKFKSNAARNYIGLSDVMDIFESSIFGGRNKVERAKMLARVQYGSLPVIEDDIDFTKKIFRSRSKYIVTKFLDDNKVEPGDFLTIVKVAAYSYKIIPAKK